MLTETMQLKMSATMMKAIEKLRQMSKLKGWTLIEQKASSTTVIVPVEKKNVKVKFYHDAEMISLWAILLKKALLGALIEDDFYNLILNLPESCLSLDGADFLDAVIESTTGGNGAYQMGAKTTTGESIESRLANLRQKVVKLAGNYLQSNDPMVGVSSNHRFTITTENGEISFQEPQDQKMALGWLTMLAKILENDCLHSDTNARLAKGLKTYQMASANPEKTTLYGGMLCCPFECERLGDELKVVKDGFVVLGSGAMLDCDTVVRENSQDDPCFKGYKTWFEIPEGAIFISYEKLDDNAPFRCRINHPRMVGGEIKPPTRAQRDTITGLTRSLSKELDAEVNYQNLEAFQSMVGDAWLAKLNGTDRRIDPNAEAQQKITKKCFSRIDSVNSQFKLPPEKRIIVNAREKIKFGLDERLTDLENPSLSLETLKRITMAYEIMAIREHFKDQPNVELSKEEATEREQIVNRFISHQLKWITGVINQPIIVFDQKDGLDGVYYLSPKEGPKFYQFNKEDLEAFEQEVSWKPRSESPTTNEGAEPLVAEAEEGEKEDPPAKEAANQAKSPNAQSSGSPLQTDENGHVLAGSLVVPAMCGRKD